MSGFHLFVPAVPGSAAFHGGLPGGCELIATGRVQGTLYDLANPGRVLLLYGDTGVPGEIWRCPAEALASLDERAGTRAGVRRRVARSVEAEAGERYACWLYVAGPALSRELLPDRRVSDRA